MFDTFYKKVVNNVDAVYPFHKLGMVLVEQGEGSSEFEAHVCSEAGNLIC